LRTGRAPVRRPLRVLHAMAKRARRRLRSSSAAEHAARQAAPLGEAGADVAAVAAVAAAAHSGERKSSQLPLSTALQPDQRGAAVSIRAARKWMADYSAVSAWSSRLGLRARLEESERDGGGLLRISDVLPPEVAWAALRALEAEPLESWNLTEATERAATNDINHRFASIRCGSRDLRRLLRIVAEALPGELSSFSAGAYRRGDHIERHDDRRYTEVTMADGLVQLCSRDIAVVLYLTPGWREEWGGQLVDEPGGPGERRLTPEFNSLVCFRVPRWHAVTAVTCDVPRYSVFGWFLRPGRLYALQNS